MPIDGDAHRLLAQWCDGLPLEPRAPLAPEDIIERDLLDGADGFFADSLDCANAGISPERRAYLVREAPIRCRALVEGLRRRYAGRCQLCDWNPLNEHGRHLAEAHHILQGGDVSLRPGAAIRMEYLVLIARRLYRRLGNRAQHSVGGA
ncbi:MAG: hypothetical protein ACIAS6_02425 [Phycisphaerales bacterium JB060]